MICTQYTSDSNDYPTNIPTLAKNVTDVTYSEDEMPQAPTSTQHMKNGYENTLVFGAGNEATIDVCHILDTPDELIISLSDEHGNLVAGVVVSPELLLNYLQEITQTQQKAS